MTLPQNYYFTDIASSNKTVKKAIPYFAEDADIFYNEKTKTTIFCFNFHQFFIKSVHDSEKQVIFRRYTEIKPRLETISRSSQDFEIINLLNNKDYIKAEVLGSNDYENTGLVFKQTIYRDNRSTNCYRNFVIGVYGPKENFSQVKIDYNNVVSSLKLAPLKNQDRKQN